MLSDDHYKTTNMGIYIPAHDCPRLQAISHARNVLEQHGCLGMSRQAVGYKLSMLAIEEACINEVAQTCSGPDSGYCPRERMIDQVVAEVLQPVSPVVDQSNIPFPHLKPTT